MKKIMTLMLGLSLLVGTVGIAFGAPQEPTTEKGKAKGKGKGKGKKGKDGKDGKEGDTK